MHQRKIAVSSGIVALIGGIVFIVYFFQPWRACPGEDTSAGCAMLPQDALVMFIATVVTTCAVAVFAMALAFKRSRTPRRGVPAVRER
jgi:hypothetical protein